MKTLDGFYYIRTYYGWNHPCACCGMSLTYEVPKTFLSSGKGIRVILGESKYKGKSKKIDSTVVQTKQGPLTVVIRTED